MKPRYLLAAVVAAVCISVITAQAVWAGDQFLSNSPLTGPITAPWPTPVSTPVPTATPSPRPTPYATPAPSPMPTPTPIPTPTPTPSPMPITVAQRISVRGHVYLRTKSGVVSAVGVKMVLTDTKGKTIATTLTNGFGGYYLASNVISRDYTVKIDTKKGLFDPSKIRLNSGTFFGIDFFSKLQR